MNFKCIPWRLYHSSQWEQRHFVRHLPSRTCKWFQHCELLYFESITSCALENGHFWRRFWMQTLIQIIDPLLKQYELYQLLFPLYLISTCHIHTLKVSGHIPLISVWVKFQFSKLIGLNWTSGFHFRFPKPSCVYSILVIGHTFY